MGLIGCVINVPTNTSQIQHALPRDIKEIGTVTMEIKKKTMLQKCLCFWSHSCTHGHEGIKVTIQTHVV